MTQGGPASTPSAASSAEVVAELGRRLEASGFGLWAPFEVNERLPTLLSNQFTFERFGLESCLGVVIGNTRSLWPHFEPVLAIESEPHPLDRYTEHHVERATREALAIRGFPEHFAVYYAHRMDYALLGGDLGAVPIQRLAELAGLAPIAPCHLSVHPQYGLWIGWRAVLVLPLAPLPHGEALVSAPTPTPCSGCTRPCLEALARALGSQGTAEPPSQRWLAVRDACPLGRDERYGAAQIRFHYAVLDRR